MAGDAVEDRAEQLRGAQPHVLEGLVDHQLLHHELVLGHGGHARRERLHGRVQRLCRYRLGDEAPLGGLAPVDQVPGEQHPLGAFGAQAIDPPAGLRAAPDPRRRVADLRVLGHQHDVAGQRDVAAARHGIAVHLAQHGLQPAPEAHDALGVPTHHLVVHHRVPGHVLAAGDGPGAFRPQLQVVPCTERPPGTGEHDHVHGVVPIGLRHRSRQVVQQRLVDRVERGGAIQRDACQPPVAGIQDVGCTRPAVGLGHGSSCRRRRSSATVGCDRGGAGGMATRAPHPACRSRPGGVWAPRAQPARPSTPC